MKNVAAQAPLTRQIATALVINASQRLAFNLPNDLSEFRIIVQVIAVAGTTPTLDAYFQDSPDGGTNYFYNGNKFTQMVGVDSRQISISRERAAGQAAAEFSGVNPAAAAAAAAVNGPVARQAAIWFALGGTAGPSFTVNVFIVGNPAQGGN